MTISFDTPGVFILEQTGPGVIAGVGTSTAGFIGPAKRGPLLKPRRITSFDDFLSLYAAPDQNGNLDPYINVPQTFYMAHAVRGFFENGGRQAFVVRIGNATSTVWAVKNRKVPDPSLSDTLFSLEALDPGPPTETKIAITVESSSLTPVNLEPRVVIAKSNVTAIDVAQKQVTVADASVFQFGDVVIRKADGTEVARIDAINGKVLTLSEAPVSGLTETRIADLSPQRLTIRMASTTGLFPGSLVKITGVDAANNPIEDHALIDSIDDKGLVTFVDDPARIPARTKTFNLATEAPKLTSFEFRLKVKPALPLQEEVFDNLSLEASHPRFVGRMVKSKLVKILTPLPPQVTLTMPQRLPVNGPAVITTPGTAVNLTTLSTKDYTDGLKALDKVDDVNFVCIPDASSRGDSKAIQRAMIDGCVAIKDRVAILDPGKGLPPSDAGSVAEQRKDLQSERGFAALYYPWLEAQDPTSTASPPLTMLIPPCGHVAGIYARTDQERGVHKAPANTDVRGILGLERVLSDGEQGPLNLQGVNVFRIFPGSNTVVVWGARTTVDPTVSDWLYVNVRRLLLFIEESIEEGIRFAVFEPNAPPLWKALKRTITQFLTQVWRDGGLFGDTPDQAFRVRIDEGLNPPDVRARGKLFIEIRVAPVRPAEFVVVRIGLFDGGAEVQEG
jgi:phage tail sheath protein FI